MNKLPVAKRSQILSMLCEGMSMRSVSRVADVSINTVSKLLVDAGEYCARFHDENVVGGKTLEVRAVEYTRTEEGGRWASIREIVDTPALLSGYMREIESLNEAAAEKMRKLRELITSKE